MQHVLIFVTSVWYAILSNLPLILYIVIYIVLVSLNTFFYLETLILLHILCQLHCYKTKHMYCGNCVIGVGINTNINIMSCFVLDVEHSCDYTYFWMKQTGYLETVNLFRMQTVLSMDGVPHLCVATDWVPHLCIVMDRVPCLLTATNLVPHLCIDTDWVLHLLTATNWVPHLCIVG